MTREELKAEALINLGSEPAPKEWEKLPCIKEQMPSCIGGEVSLQRFVGTDICAWFVGIGGLWEPQSDYFRVSLPPAEGAEEMAQRCPVCGGNGLVPNGFYDQTSGQWTSCSTLPETCRTCNGTGVILPSYLHAQKIADKMAEEKCAKCKHRGLPDSIQEALNSGDGVYRP